MCFTMRATSATSARPGSRWIGQRTRPSDSRGKGEARAAASEPAFANDDRITRANRVRDGNDGRHRLPFHGSRQLGLVSLTARGEPPRDRHGRLYSHSIDKRVLAGGRDLAQDEEGPILL